MTKREQNKIVENKGIKNPPYKCKSCGKGNIEQEFDICEYCGWEDNNLQNEHPDYMGGANRMSLNQYKKFWEENKQEILKYDNRTFITIKLAKEYYKKHFEKKS